jgi:hypothetical protein
MQETPRYADISSDELAEIENEFGHPVSRELALWFVRNRSRREAIERMIGAAGAVEIDSEPDISRRPAIGLAPDGGQRPKVYRKRAASAD